MSEILKKSERIAVVGSAANPVTKAHRQSAELLTHSGIFDRIFWFPSGLRPDKPQLIAGEHRARMTELAFNSEWRAKQPIEFRIDLREIGRPSIPTIQLLCEIKKEHPAAEIIFATGVDVVTPRDEYGGTCDVLHHWYEGESLFSDWTFAVWPREGYPRPRALQEAGKIPEHFMVFEESPSPMAGISSTEIRERIAQGKSFDDFVEPVVAEYIRANRLYQS